MPSLKILVKKRCHVFRYDMDIHFHSSKVAVVHVIFFSYIDISLHKLWVRDVNNLVIYRLQKLLNKKFILFKP
jgi:hypothetical protein